MKFIKKYWILIMVVFLLLAIIKMALCFLLLSWLIAHTVIDSMRVQKKLLASGIRCTGEILSFKGGRQGPIIKFTPIGGDEITGQPYFYSSSDLGKISSYKKLIGKEVLVIYDPDDARKFALPEGFPGNSLASLAALFVCSVFAILAIASLLGYIKLGN